jgi:hypothetical protein
LLRIRPGNPRHYIGSGSRRPPSPYPTQIEAFLVPGAARCRLRKS